MLKFLLDSILNDYVVLNMSYRSNVVLNCLSITINTFLFFTVIQFKILKQKEKFLRCFTRKYNVLIFVMFFNYYFASTYKSIKFENHNKKCSYFAIYFIQKVSYQIQIFNTLNIKFV